MEKPAGIAVMVGGPKRPDAEREEEGEGEEMDASAEAKRSAIQDLFRALEAKDVEAGVAAMDAFVKACGYGEAEPDKDDEKGGADGYPERD